MLDMQRDGEKRKSDDDNDDEEEEEDIQSFSHCKSPSMTLSCLNPRELNEREKIKREMN